MGQKDRARRAYLDLMARVTEHWLAIFEGDTDLYSTAYWDLLTALWTAGRPMRKTDALASIKGVKSAHTAGKYLDAAVRRGLVIETENPADARSKLLQLTPEMHRRLDRFFDEALDEVQTTATQVARRTEPQDSR